MFELVVSMNNAPIIFVIISAALFGISMPIAKLLVKEISPVILAGLLYFGAFAGLFLYSVFSKNKVDKRGMAPLSKEDFPWLAGAVISGGVIAPISMMTGLKFISGFSASLLLNLEGLVTAVIAVFLFKENAGRSLWLALACMALGGIFLAWDPGQNKFHITGPLLILIAMICWGIDNNLTRHISDKDPVQIAEIKGFVAGVTSLLIGFILGMRVPVDFTLLFALLVGAFSYGISLVFFTKALRGLGSFRTGAFFSIAPFIGALASLVMLKEWIGWVMFPAAFFMIVSVWLMVNEKHLHLHFHEDIVHTHSHTRDDMHHFHEHSDKFRGPHAHEHNHVELSHLHAHWPDTHHRHEH